MPPPLLVVLLLALVSLSSAQSCSVIVSREFYVPSKEVYTHTYRGNVRIGANVEANKFNNGNEGVFVYITEEASSLPLLNTINSFYDGTLSVMSIVGEADGSEWYVEGCAVPCGDNACVICGACVAPGDTSNCKASKVRGSFTSTLGFRIGVPVIVCLGLCLALAYHMRRKAERRNKLETARDFIALNQMSQMVKGAKAQAAAQQQAAANMQQQGAGWGVDPTGGTAGGAWVGDPSMMMYEGGGGGDMGSFTSTSSYPNQFQTGGTYTPAPAGVDPMGGYGAAPGTAGYGTVGGHDAYSAAPQTAGYGSGFDQQHSGTFSTGSANVGYEAAW
jgi:hypothetical protein